MGFRFVRGGPLLEERSLWCSMNDRRKMKTLSVIIATSIILAGDCFGANGNPSTDQASAARLNARGFALLSKIYPEKLDDGVFISPYSIDSAFGLAWLAAEGKTREEIADGLGFRADAVDVFHRVRGLLDSASDVQFLSANSIWMQPTISVDRIVRKDAEHAFGASFRTADFTKEREVVDAINSFISDGTQGMIRNPIDSIDGNTRLMLVNATYFKASWLKAFDKELTQPLKYTLANGKTKPVWAMNDTRRVLCFESQDMQAIILPYKNRRFQFVVILPPKTESMGALLSRLENGGFANIVQNARGEKCQITIPKINKDFQMDDFKNMLQAFGVKSPFDPKEARFPGWKNEQGGPLYIDKVIHATKLCVDEVETKAAAATCVAVKECRMPMLRTFVVNRPFVAVIYDTTTELVLFAGVVNDPGCDAPAATAGQMIDEGEDIFEEIRAQNAALKEKMRRLKESLEEERRRQKVIRERNARRVREN